MLTSRLLSHTPAMFLLLERRDHFLPQALFRIGRGFVRGEGSRGAGSSGAHFPKLGRPLVTRRWGEKNSVPSRAWTSPPRSLRRIRRAGPSCPARRCESGPHPGISHSDRSPPARRSCREGRRTRRRPARLWSHRWRERSHRWIGPMGHFPSETRRGRRRGTGSDPGAARGPSLGPDHARRWSMGHTWKFTLLNCTNFCSSSR